MSNALKNTVNQVSAELNKMFSQITGNEIILAEDLSNIVDIGKEITASETAVDNYTEQLMHIIGKFDFAQRVYAGDAPKVYRDGTEYGAIKAKVRCDVFEAQDDPAWSLQDGQIIDNQQFYKPDVKETLFDKTQAYEIPCSFAAEQSKGSLRGPDDFRSFIGMIQTAIGNTRQIQNDSLIMSTINNYIANTIHDEYGTTGLATASKTRAVNLLYLYNQAAGTTLAADKALEDAAFLRFASRVISNYSRYFRKANRILNKAGFVRFTGVDQQHIVMLHDFEAALMYNMVSNTYHEDIVSLPMHETVACWQGLEDLTYSKLSKINVKTSAAIPATITTSGIVGCMFDHDALGVTNEYNAVRTAVNAHGDFYNNYYKYRSGYFNAMDEQFVVFLIA